MTPYGPRCAVDTEMRAQGVPMNGDQTRLTFELQKELDAMRQEYLALTPPDIAETFRKAAEELVLSGIEERSLKVGQRVPDFVLPNAVGRDIRLSAVTAGNTAVISFYRGAW